MRINGNEVTLIGKDISYEEIGKMLMEASLGRSGEGLVVTLTESEEEVFCQDYGLAVGRTISNLIGKEIKKEGREVKFKYTYTKYTFQTTRI